MRNLPDDTRWYLADVVLEIRVEGGVPNLVYINTHLVRACSPDQAYEKGLTIGRESEHQYENCEGGQVHVVFRGLRELLEVYEALEDGAELMFSSEEGVSEERLQGWILPKDKLAVFAARKPSADLPKFLPVEFREFADESDQTGGEPPAPGPED